MQFELDPARIEQFEDEMGRHGPWMHPFRFHDRIITGYFKEHGIGQDLTFVNRRSAAADVDRLRRAYETRRHEIWYDFVDSLFEKVAPSRTTRASMHVLDIASATGQVSFLAARAGFGRITSSEIRDTQVALQRLILECVKDPSYAERITPMHDPVSADVPEFTNAYAADPPNVACSFGLLYHLTNPLQHLQNLFAITRQHAIIYTMTHYHPLAKNMWYLTPEDAGWATKAMGSISWTPHFSEVARLCRQVGFRRVEVAYPAMFHDNFPEMTGSYSRVTDLKLAAQMAIHRYTGVRLGHLRNHDPRLFMNAVNPNYVAYVCSK
jgi:SAM-dependent methyltransferase